MKINDRYSITNCHNGFLVEVSGEDSTERWVSYKHVVKTIEELRDLVQDLGWMQRA